MPMYWVDFWMAVEGQSDTIVVAYMRGLSFYWHHNHCVGLKDDSEFLRKVFRIEKDEWPNVQEILLDGNHFFRLDPVTNLWHQDRCRAEWERQVASYNAQQARAIAGGEANRIRILKLKKARRIA